jgi:sirohydrochlorin ferrochelatase
MLSLTKRPSWRLTACCLLLCVAPVMVPAQMASNRTGILLLAHGGSKEWNQQVQDIARQVDAKQPTEVAFGMADRTTLQASINKLVGRGVQQIVAVPLFVSSHSGVLDALGYLLGVRPAPPADLEDLTGMDHGMSNMKPDAAASAEKKQPVHSPVPLRMTAALDRHPLVGEILLDRAAAISRKPAREDVILVAHGPQADADNRLWLGDMEALAQQIRSHRPFAHVSCLTLRDDADEPIRSQATAELRDHVAEAAKHKHRALVVPLLLSYGGIDNGLRKRLDGLDHVMSAQALLPDARIVQWVLDSAADDRQERADRSVR